MADMVGTSDGKTYTSDMDHYLEYSGLKQSPNERVSQTFDQVYKAIDEGTMDPQGRNNPPRDSVPFSFVTKDKHSQVQELLQKYGIAPDTLAQAEDDPLIPPPANPTRMIDPASKTGKVLGELGTIIGEHILGAADAVRAPGRAFSGYYASDAVDDPNAMENAARHTAWWMGFPITKFPIAKYPTSARLAPDNVIPINREQTSIQPWDVPLGEHANQNIPGLDQLRYPPFLPKNASEESITRVLQQMEEEHKFSLATDKPIPDPQLHMPAKTQEEIRAILEQRAKEGGYKIDKDGMIISDPYVDAQIQASWNDMIKKQKDLTDKIARERRAKFVVHEGSTEKK